MFTREPISLLLRTRMRSRKESFKMRVNFSLAGVEQTKPKVTAVEESSRRQEGTGTELWVMWP